MKEARLAAARTELEAAETEVKTAETELTDAQHKFKELEPRLSFSPKLPTRCCCQSWVGSEGKLGSALPA